MYRRNLKKVETNIFRVYLPPLSAICALTAKNVTKMFFPKDFFFYVLGDFNLLT